MLIDDWPQGGGVVIPEKLPKVLGWDHFREVGDDHPDAPSPLFGGQVMQWRLVDHVALVVRHKGASMGAELWGPEVCVYWVQHTTYTSARHPGSVMATVCGKGLYWALGPPNEGDREVEYLEREPGVEPTFMGRPLAVCPKCREVYQACKGRPFWSERKRGGAQ